MKIGKYQLCSWTAMLEYLTIVLNSLKRRYLRTALTMIGIFIGIAAVVSLVSLSEGLKTTVNEQFEAMGADKLMITYKGSFMPGVNADNGGLTTKDVKFVKNLKDIEDAMYWYIDSVEVEFGNQKLFLPTTGFPTDDKQDLFKEIWYFGIEKGRELKAADKYKLNIGIAFFEDNAFKKNVKLRDKLTLNGEDFKVVGHYERVGNSQDDKNIFIQEDMFKEFFNRDEGVDIIVAKVRAGLNPTIVADRVERQLRNFRNLKEGNEDFDVQSSEEMMAIFTDILNIIQVLLVGISGISLFVGGIGIMNTMYTSVTERTQEIGIMKAIGARNEDIFVMFFIESGLLGMSGGIIGVTTGYLFAKAIEYLAITQLKTNLLTPHFPLSLIIGSLLFAFVVGALSGTLPALQAAKLKPVEALRYE